MVARNEVKATKRHKENLKKCEADPSLVPILYNSTMNLRKLRDKVGDMKTRRQCW